ncbi:MAG: hypothetical protein EXR98_17805 [Gemmataceae bacterium]|nr:hypothetical protein [Gemmataceae bacterium]
MPIRVKCESCKKTLSVKDHLAGKKIKCPVCQSVLAVPQGSPMKEPAPPNAPAQGIPVPSPGAKKAAAATKPLAPTKPTVEKPDSNGTPAAKPNGTPPPTQELPPENVEDEALAAFSDEPEPPPIDPAAPTTIEFKCPYCDEQVKLPIELAGKQAQCPNEECRRLVKVPLPKPAEKKDWRKMDRKGPTAAILNQPEQLENAWGTEVASKARQDSLVQAGVIDLPIKTRPRDLFDRIQLGIYTMLLIALVGGAGYGLWHIVNSKQQQNEIKDAEGLVRGANAKIKSGTLLSAEAYRTIGLLYLRSSEKNPAVKAQKALQGASLVEFDATERNPALNEQLFLIDVALAQIELGGGDADLIGAIKLPWEEVRADLDATLLSRLQNPEIQVMALREVGFRLFEKGQAELAIGLTVKPAGANAQGKRPAAYRQQIAFIFAKGEPESLKKLPSEKSLMDANIRIGYAEGYARKGDYGKSEEFVKASGPPKDRLDANLGVAAVALHDPKNKDQAGKFVKEAMNIIKEKDANPSDWQMLQLVKLAARTEEAEIVKELAKTLKHPTFKLRAEFEIFLALCEKSTGRVDAGKLVDIEGLDLPAKTAKQDATTGATLALAWTALARHNGGASRKAFNERVTAIDLAPEIADRIRPMIEIGSYQGSMK